MPCTTTEPLARCHDDAHPAGSNQKEPLPSAHPRRRRSQLLFPRDAFRTPAGGNLGHAAQITPPPRRASGRRAYARSCGLSMSPGPRAGPRSCRCRSALHANSPSCVKKCRHGALGSTGWHQVLLRSLVACGLLRPQVRLQARVDPRCVLRKHLPVPATIAFTPARGVGDGTGPSPPSDTVPRPCHALAGYSAGYARDTPLCLLTRDHHLLAGTPLCAYSSTGCTGFECPMVKCHQESSLSPWPACSFTCRSLHVCLRSGVRSDPRRLSEIL
jgi:hypothetical protein